MRPAAQTSTALVISQSARPAATSSGARYHSVPAALGAREPRSRARLCVEGDCRERRRRRGGGVEYKRSTNTGEGTEGSSLGSCTSEQR